MITAVYLNELQQWIYSVIMDDNKIAVKPTRDGMKLVHIPSGIELPDEGGRWPNDQFTFRRLRDGDIERVDQDKS